MKDLPELRARLHEIAATAPRAKPIDARARRKIRVRQSTLVAVTAISVVALATTGFALSSREVVDRSSGERRVAGQKGPTKDGCVWRIATLGALSGEHAPIGTPIADAVDFAVGEANEHRDLACRVELRAEDSQGDPNVAPELARKIVEDEAVVACVCPYFSGETLASGGVFSSAGVLMTGTGTHVTIGEQGFGTWFGAVAPDDFQGQIAADLIASMGAGNVAVVDDQDSPATLAAAVRTALGERVGGVFTIAPGDDDLALVAGQVAAIEPDFVFFGGYTPQAGLLLGELRRAGVAAPFMGGPGSKHPSFGRRSGEAAGGALAVCPCADPTRIESAAEFVEGMRSANGPDSPGAFGVEAYDVTSLVVEALSAYEGDPADIDSVRAHVVGYFGATEGYDGLATTYSWDESGRQQSRSDAVWIYEWDLAEEAFVARGPASDFLD